MILLSKLPFVPSWITILLTIVLLTVAYLTGNNHKQFQNLFRSFFIRGLISQLVREESGLLNRIQIIMNLVYFLLVALLINSIVPLGFSLTMLAFTIVFGVYLIKYFGLFLLGNAFKLPKIASEYSFNIFLLNVFNGILLLPVIIGMYYISYQNTTTFLLYVSSTIILLSFGIRLFKLLQVVSVHKSVSILYLFIYICTLEIMPLLVGTKILILDSKLF